MALDEPGGKKHVPSLKRDPARWIALAQVAALSRVLVATAGKAALQRALPLYLGVVLVATIVLEGNGLKPSTLTGLAAISLPFRVGFWSVWLLIATPATRALLGTPSTFYLRTLPVPRWQFLVVLGAWTGVAEAPWIALWARGAGLLAGLSAGAAALAAHALIEARPQRAEEIAVGALLVGAIALGAPAPLLLLAAAPAAGVGLRTAWIRAPERSSVPRRSMIVGPAVVALSLAHLLTLARSQGALLLRATLLIALSVIGATRAARNNGLLAPEALAALSLGALAPAVLIASSSLTGPILRTERQASWLLDVCGTSARVRALTAALAVAACGLAEGLIHGAVVSWLLGLGGGAALRLIGGAALAGVELGVIAACCVRWAMRHGGRDGARIVLSVLATIAFAVAAVAALRELALAVWATLALIAVFMPGLVAASREGRGSRGRAWRPS
jgi:hypothetical protein